MELPQQESRLSMTKPLSPARPKKEKYMQLIYELYGLIEEDGPNEGEFVCELSKEECESATALGNRTISMQVYQYGKQASHE